MSKPVLGKYDYSVFGNKAEAGASSGAGSSQTGMGKMDYVNAGLGAVGLIKALTNKKPKLQAPEKMRSVVRPASGDQEGLSRAKSDINSATRASLRSIRGQAGSNISAYIRGAQALHANQAAAIRKAEGQNSQLYKQDQNRMYGELNRDRQVNNQLQNQYIGQKNNLNYQEFLRKQQFAEGTMNSSLNYENQRQANLKANEQAVGAGNQRLGMMAEMEVQRQKAEYLKNNIAWTPEIEEEIRQNILRYSR